MSSIDWIVLIGVQLFIVAYGIWKSRGSKDIRGYLLANKEMKWSTIGLSIMATQASAITFLSTPGQAYADGMRFIHFYLGLPLAMVVISMVAVPIYHRLNVYTAYEYLEGRFDLRMRSLTAGLFLVQRSIAAGFSIYAPAIILSKAIGWPVDTLSIIIGLIVISYTVTGGSKAVSYTQKQQMVIILIGMVIATYLMIDLLPEDVSLNDAVVVAGKMGRLNVIDFEFDPTSKYNIWTGLLGGFFLALSYFGTDQSQVQRYLGGKSVAESKLGLLMNGMLKIPMQFLILFVGALLFVFYIYNEAPVHFNTAERKMAVENGNAEAYQALENSLSDISQQKKTTANELLDANDAGNEALVSEKQGQLKGLLQEEGDLREKAIKLIREKEFAEVKVEGGKKAEEIAREEFKENSANRELNTTTLKSLNEVLITAREKGEKDAEEKLAQKYEKAERDYVFITFVMENLPEGIVGLLIAVIIAAAMSSASSELNALSTTTVIDIHKRNIVTKGSDSHYLKASKWYTLMWGVMAIFFTQFADKLGNLIQAVNTIGSLVYGVILGIFLVAFFLKRVGGTATFIAAIISELLVLYCYNFTDIPFLWFNIIGCIPLIMIAALLQELFFNKPKAS